MGTRHLPIEESYTLKKEEISPLHALVIGIDNFESDKIDNLQGAAADANSFEVYLKEHLRVPKAQIVSLRNKEATRSAIIRELGALCAHPTIKMGDPIVIYFAGHGTAYEAPTGWYSATGKISSIVPCDCYMQDENEKKIDPIPDRTVAVLLDKLADPDSGKGNNITVIFDCCHSGSGTRSPGDHNNEQIRSCSPDGIIPVDLDEHIWGHEGSVRTFKTPSGFGHTGTKSHVLLAACTSYEKARERQGCGLFTEALLKALRASNVNKTTYNDLRRRIPQLDGQTPQCEGEHTDRFLFNALSINEPTLYQVKSQDENRYTMDAGAIHGITEQSKFAIYESRLINSDVKPVAMMKAETVEAFSTKMSIVPLTKTHDFTEGFALKTSATMEEVVKLYIPSCSGLRPRFEAKSLKKFEDSGKRPIHFVTEALDSDSADIGVSAVDNGQIEYYIKNKFITRHIGESYKLYKINNRDDNEIQQVIQSAAHFFWHLRRCPKKEGCLQSEIQVKFHRIRKFGEPNGPQFEENLIEHNVINVKADNETEYGMTIENKCNISLHIFIFFFDCGDLTVEPYYLPSPKGQDAEPSLPIEGKLRIGYGDGGVSSKVFELPSGLDKDIGFLKIFISTKPVDMKEIQHNIAERGMKNPDKKPPPDTWDTLTIPIIQHRHWPITSADRCWWSPNFQRLFAGTKQ